MHFVTGGAYNGKAKWVRDTYMLANNCDFCWISAYKDEKYEGCFSCEENKFIVLEGIEQWIRDLVKNEENIDLVRERCRKFISQCEQWEKNDRERTLIMIGTDMMKGVVPIDQKVRQWRDATGLVFQDIVQIANRVDLIWYGMANRLK